MITNSKTRRKKASAKAEPTLLQKTALELNLKYVKPTTKAVDRMFQKWLKQNGKKFPYRVNPRQRKTKLDWPHQNRLGQYGFRGLATELYFTVAADTLQVHFDLKGEYYDSMCDFEVMPVQRADGKYSCAWCAHNWQERLRKTSREVDWRDKVKKEKYFATLAELYADHCFDRLLSWCKKTLKPGRLIVYCGEPDASRWALIRPAREVLDFTRADRVLALVVPKK